MAVPVLRYSVRIINWNVKEKQKLDRRTTTEPLPINGQHHPRADIDRLYIPRKYGDRSLMQVKRDYVQYATLILRVVRNAGRQNH
jgi:hypothetical protein